jgi:uncharacterized membrane protein YhhN
MNKNSWLFLFLVVLIVNSFQNLRLNPVLEMFSKPLLVIALSGYFIASIKGQGKKLRMWILLALFFSWIGDILLMFVPKNEFFFLLGLSAFLLAHIFYIVFFHKVRVRESIRGNGWLLLIVIVYYASLLSFLSDYLGEMNLPVKIYGVIISFMFMLALHMLFLKNKRTGLLMMLGALLFVISDSVLAVNKFYRAFEGAGFLIMITYGLAQLLIAEGAARYINYDSKR